MRIVGDRAVPSEGKSAPPPWLPNLAGSDAGCSVPYSLTMVAGNVEAFGVDPPYNSAVAVRQYP